MEKQNNSIIYKISFTALMAALCYAAFTYLKIPIPTLNGDTTVELKSARNPYADKAP